MITSYHMVSIVGGDVSPEHDYMYIHTYTTLHCEHSHVMLTKLNGTEGTKQNDAPTSYCETALKQRSVSYQWWLQGAGAGIGVGKGVGQWVGQG